MKGWENPVHFSRTDLVVKYGNKSMSINQSLLTTNNTWSNLEYIKQLGKNMLELESFMEVETDSNIKAKYKSLWLNFESKMFKAYGVKL